MAFKNEKEENLDAQNIELLLGDKQSSPHQKWTLCLFLCCVVVSLGTLQFGFNIGSLNSVTPIIKDFYSKEAFLLKEYHAQLNHHNSKEYLSGNKTNQHEEFLNAQREKIERLTDILWTVTNCLFVLGGMTGAVFSKFFLDHLGRKKSILVHNLFSIIASILAIIAPRIKSPVCIMVSRYLFGVQGGLSCSLIPTYLSEISPAALRGQTGAVPQLFITSGILIAQLLGFRQIIGTEHLWNYLLAVPIIPAVVCFLALLLFFPETPKALLIKSKDVDAARKALKMLRNSNDVNEDLREIYQEANPNGSSNDTITMKYLFTSRELRWPLITSIVIQMSQQLSGINAIFFYSSSIFSETGISNENIQYAIFLTGFVNALASISCVPLLDRLGRRPLLIFPISSIIIIFILLVVFLTFKHIYFYFAYLSIACILIFIVAFAVGLGPIPFIYSAECFRQNARSSAIAIATFLNWLSGLILTLCFPFLQSLLKQYVFLVFAGIMSFSLMIIIKKVPETKGKNVEEIIASF